MDEQTTKTAETTETAGMGRKARGGKMAALGAAARAGATGATAPRRAAADELADLAHLMPPTEESEPLEIGESHEMDRMDDMGIMPMSDELEPPLSVRRMTAVTTPRAQASPEPPPATTNGHSAPAARDPLPAAIAGQQRIIALLERLDRRLAEGETTRDEPAPEEPPQSATQVLNVVEVTPVIKSLERIRQTIGERLDTLTEFTERQDDYLEEIARAQNEVTSGWYKIASQMPAVERKLTDLQGTIGRRQAEMDAAARGVKRAATRAVALIAVVAVLAMVALIGMVYLTAKGHRLL